MVKVEAQIYILEVRGLIKSGYEFQDRLLSSRVDTTKHVHVLSCLCIGHCLIDLQKRG